MYKNNEILPSATTWMDDGPGSMTHSEKVRQRQILWVITPIWDLKNKTNELNKYNQTKKTDSDIFVGETEGGGAR